jgi:hypothetical protein
VAHDGWTALVAGTHPTILQRIAMTVAYERRRAELGERAS